MRYHATSNGQVPFTDAENAEADAAETAFYARDVFSARIIATANQLANDKRSAATKGISPAEMAGWAIKRQEAIAYNAGDITAAPNLSAEAQARGITVQALVQKVLSNADQLLALESAIAGRRGQIQDAAQYATTGEELAAIDIYLGWPI